MQVEQIDREAAADNTVLAEMRELIREGRADHHAEPFARHRHQAREQVVGEIVVWLREGSTRACAFADEIEAKFGGHDAE